MNRKTLKFISIFLCCILFSQQTGFAQVASVELNIASHFASLQHTLTPDKFRPLHLRYLSYDRSNNNFNLLLDKGDTKNPKTQDVESTTKNLLNYFFVGISLTNDTFWVNLRPDSPDNIIDPLLAQTEVGRILLEADLQLKKDTANATNPQTLEGKEYWNKLYQKAGQIYGNQNVTIPTLTRPWIVPDEIIIRESVDSAYVHKATLKVMLEQDYLKNDAAYSFNDPRQKELNAYSSQLIREKILPKLIKDINNAKRYAPLRQVYYSLILAQWFKARNQSKDTQYSRLIDKKDLTNLQSQATYSVSTYFTAYKENFAQGEYNIKEPASTAYGQVIRSYFSGGITNIAPVIPSLGQPTLIDSKGTKITVVPDNKLINPNKNNIPAEIRLVTPEEGQISSSPLGSGIKRWLTIGGMTVLMAITLQSNNTFAQNNGGLKDILEISVSGSKAIADEALRTLNLEKLIKLATQGNRDAIDALATLVSLGNTTAKEALKTLDPAEFIKLATQGNRDAISTLGILVSLGNTTAKEAVKTLDPAEFIKLATQGNRYAISTLGILVSWGNTAAKEAVKTLDPAELIKSATQGNRYAISILGTLASWGNTTAKEALKTLDPAEFIKLATQSNNYDAIYALKTLASWGNTAVTQRLFHLVSQNRADSENILKWISDDIALLLRREHLDRGVSGQALDDLVQKETLDNNQLLYCVFVSPENFGDLAKIIFKRLNNQAKEEGIDLLTYLKKIDPQKLFYKDFILQAANFSLLDDMLTAPGALENALNEIFMNLTKEETVSYSMRLALFVEAVVNDEGFSLQKEFQNDLMRLYRQTQGINQYLVSGLLYLYRDKLIYLNQEDIIEISKKQGIFYLPVQVPYTEIMKDGRIVTHIIFADEPAVSGHYEPTVKFFQEKGYQLSLNKSNEAILKKGILEVYLFKAADGNYDIENHMKAADIISSRSHAGAEERVFAPQNTRALNDYQGILFPSACRSATVLPNILKPYPNAKGIGINSTAYGEKSNIVTYYFMEGLKQRIKTFLGIKDFIRPHLEEGIKDYIFPGEPAPALYELMKKYNKSGGSSSPVSQETSLKVTSSELIDETINKSGQSSSSPVGASDVGEPSISVKAESIISKINSSNRDQHRKPLKDIEFTFQDEKFSEIKTFLKEKLRIKLGSQVIEVGRIDDISLDVAIAELGSHYLGYSLDKDNINDSRIRYYNTEEFGGSVRYILGEFSSGQRSNSKVDIHEHSQDVVFIITGALSDPYPESDAKETFREVLRVIKSGGKLVAGTIGLWEEYEREKAENIMQEVLQEDAYKNKVRLTAIENVNVHEFLKRNIVTIYEIAFNDSFQNNSNSSPVEVKKQAINPGGIDFRFLPIVTQSMDSLKASIRSLPRNSLQDVNLTKEWSDIERLVNSGITLSTERLKEYFAASYYKNNLDNDMEKIVSCISDILRQEEESCCSTDPMLKDMLVVLGSARSKEELKLVFNGV